MNMKGYHHNKPCRSRQAGVASIEFVLVFPVLLLLFFGLVNFAHYISTSQRIAQAAVLASDLATRTESPVKAAAFTDIFTAVELAATPLPISNIRVDIYDYYLLGGTTPAMRWKKSSPNGPPCTAPDPTVAPIRTLLTPSNQTSATDVVVAVVCMAYAAPVPDFPGLTQLFSNITLRRSMALRPRSVATLQCQAC